MKIKGMSAKNDDGVALGPYGSPKNFIWSSFEYDL